MGQYAGLPNKPKYGKAVEKILKFNPMFVQFRGWTSEMLVRDQLGNPPLEPEDCRYLGLCVRAANRAVAYWRPDLEPPAVFIGRGPFSKDFSWEFKGGANVLTPTDPMICLGTTMLAARWFQRKGGFDVASFAEMGAGPLPVLDADLSVILRVGRAHAPVVA